MKIAINATNNHAIVFTRSAEDAAAIEHLLLSVERANPGLHLEHEVASSHLIQLLMQATEQLDSSIDPVELVVVPFAQLLQLSECELFAKEPSRHSLQPDDLDPENDPAGQSRHWLDFAEEYWPGSQSLHMTAPSRAYVPEGQLVQREEPFAE